MPAGLFGLHFLDVRGRGHPPRVRRRSTRCNRATKVIRNALAKDRLAAHGKRRCEAQRKRNDTSISHDSPLTIREIELFKLAGNVPFLNDDWRQRWTVTQRGIARRITQVIGIVRIATLLFFRIIGTSGTTGIRGTLGKVSLGPLF